MRRNTASNGSVFNILKSFFGRIDRRLNILTIWWFGYSGEEPGNGKTQYSNHSICTSANRRPLQGTRFWFLGSWLSVGGVG